MATIVTKNTNELEDRLAELAFEFRQAGSNTALCDTIAHQYERVFDDLVKTAGRFVEPHFDSLLPDGYMPKQYEERKAQLADGMRAKKSYNFQWVFRIVPTSLRQILVRDR